MNMKSTILKIHPNDNVAVALSFLKKGMELNTGAESFILEEDIPQGHKLALRDIPSGTSVVKYGSPIGTASSYIQKGSWVHTHNLKTDLDGQLTYSYKGHIIEPAPREERFFPDTGAAAERPVSATRSGSFPPLAVSTAWLSPSPQRLTLAGRMESTA